MACHVQAQEQAGGWACCPECQGGQAARGGTWMLEESRETLAQNSLKFSGRPGDQSTVRLGSGAAPGW